MAVNLFEAFFIDWFSVTRYFIYLYAFSCVKRKKCYPEMNIQETSLKMVLAALIYKNCVIGNVINTRGSFSRYAFCVLNHPTQILSFKTHTETDICIEHEIEFLLFHRWNVFYSLLAFLKRLNPILWFLNFLFCF